MSFGHPPHHTQMQKRFIWVHWPAHWKEEMRICWGSQISQVYSVLPVYKQVASSSYPIKQLAKLIYSTFIEYLWDSHRAIKRLVKYLYSFLMLDIASTNESQWTKTTSHKIKTAAKTGVNGTCWGKNSSDGTKKVVRAYKMCHWVLCTYC